MILRCDEPGCTTPPYEIDEDSIGDSPRSAAMRLNNHRKQKHGLGPLGTAPEGDPMDDDSTVADGTGPYGGAPPALPTGEVPPAPGGGNRSAGVEPAPRRRGVFDRFRKTPKGEGAPARPTKENPPKPPKGARGKRLSGADELAWLWGIGGAQLQRIGHLPTGRMIRFQAPVAGEMLDDVIAGTVVDRLALQRIVGAKGKLEMLYAIVGPPAITWKMEQAYARGDDDQLAMLEEMLKSCIKDGLPHMLPAMKKIRKREAETNAAFADLLDEEDLAAMGIAMMDGKPVDQDGKPVDVAGVFVTMLFAEWTPPTAPPPRQKETTTHE